MSINFSTLKGLTIPEGNVTQIADASGRVLWSAVENLTVTMTKANPSNVTAYISWDGGRASEPGTYNIPAGTDLGVTLNAPWEDLRPVLYWNGVEIYMGSQYWDADYGKYRAVLYYRFTLTSNIEFYFAYVGKGTPAIYINEV